MSLANQELRTFLKSEKLPFWKIADELGVHELTFSKKMRKELSEEEKQKVIEIAKKIKENG